MQRVTSTIRAGIDMPQVGNMRPLVAGEHCASELMMTLNHAEVFSIELSGVELLQEVQSLSFVLSKSPVATYVHIKSLQMKWLCLVFLLP